ncbi:MAG: hypothetical protein IJV67_08020, partial [Clostridia bacterium]|nr:hypothetical protein [Clostridia bacterium]
PTDDIYVYLSQIFGNFRGMFYTNFKTFFCYLFPYEYMGVESGGIGIEYQYPANGVGYDNYVYNAYFDKGIKSNPVMDDYTREAKTKIDALYTAEEIEQWLNLEVTAENKQRVIDFGEAVKEARVYYNNVADPVQQSFLTAGSGEKISALETSLRAVKAHFGIEVKIKGLTYDSDYKKEYFAGETFDLGSLVVIIEYDDGSTEVADPAGLTLVTGVLDTYTRAVSINGNYGGSVYTLRVTVSVTEKPQSPEDSSSSSSSSSEQDSTGSSQSSSTQISSSDGGNGGNVGLIVGISAGAVAVIAAAVVVIFIKKRK